MQACCQAGRLPVDPPSHRGEKTQLEREEGNGADAENEAGGRNPDEAEYGKELVNPRVLFDSRDYAQRYASNDPKGQRRKGQLQGEGVRALAPP